jgi:hypothetical protein
MTRGIGSVGAVSRARMMAYDDALSEIDSAMNNQNGTHNQFRTIVGLWATGTALREVPARETRLVNWAHVGRENTHRGSLGPHHTPMPATDPACPFLEQAPSVYTTFPKPFDDDEVGFDGPALALSGAWDRPARSCDSDPDPAMGVGVGVIVNEDDGGEHEPTAVFVWLSDGRLSASSNSVSGWGVRRCSTGSVRPPA